MPSNSTFAANTVTGNTSYWNNKSSDAPAGSPFDAATQGFNVGYFLTVAGAFSGNSLSPAPDRYLASTGNHNWLRGAFSLLRGLWEWVVQPRWSLTKA